MTPDSYRAAYEAALAEVTEISAKFEQLRIRKSQIEDLIAVLQPMFAAEGTPVAVSATLAPAQSTDGEASPADAQLESEAEPSYSYLDVPNPLPTGDGDPFQRRVKTNFRYRGLAAQRSS